MEQRNASDVLVFKSGIDLGFRQGYEKGVTDILKVFIADMNEQNDYKRVKRFIVEYGLEDYLPLNRLEQYKPDGE